MPVPTTNDEFLDLVRKSGVADDAKLNAYLEKLKTGSTPPPPQPSKFAIWLVRDGLITYFQAEQILQGKYKRFTIGKYKVLEKLGVGGMGQVFLCEHKMMKRRVAVKVLPIAKSDDDSARERFYREARAVASLDHPNIVRAYDVDQDENLHFLVMEYVDGTNLHDLVKKHGVLSVERACHYIYASAAGLQYANQMGIVHRDIKPANLLVDRGGVVKILDMGLARFFKDEDESLTRKFDENVLGTADYLAPEQAIDSHNVDIRADLYSLGGTFYFLLTGSAPFPEGSIAQKLLMHQQKDPKPISLIRPEVPEEVSSIVEKLMAKKPEDRYADPAEVMAALTPFVQTPIPPPTAAEMPKLSRAALGGATAMSSIGRPQASGVLLAQSSVSGIPVMPIGAAATSAVIDAPKAIWEDIAAETSPAVAADTDPKSGKQKTAAPTRRKPAADEPVKKNKYLLYGGLAALVIALGVGGFLVLGKKDKTTPPASSANVAPEPTGPRTLFVTRNEGAADTTFKSIRKAMEKARAGDTIQLLDDEHEEAPFAIDPLKIGQYKGCVIESGKAGKIAKVLLPRGSAINATSFVKIGDADGLTLRNLSFDAAFKLKFVIEVSGRVDGLRLENVHLRSATEANLALRNTVASPEQPLRIEKCWFFADRGLLDGVQIITEKDHVVSDVLLENCRFNGRTSGGDMGWNALHLKGAVRDITFRNNRIYQFECGVKIDGGSSNAYQLTVSNNTFHTIKNAVLDVGGLPNNVAAKLNLKYNYFAKAGEILKGAGNKIPGLTAQDNAKEPGTKNGAQGLDPKAADANGYTMPQPSQDDESFLRIDGGPLTSFGKDRLKIGAQ